MVEGENADLFERGRVVVYAIGSLHLDGITKTLQGKLVLIGREGGFAYGILSSLKALYRWW
jgi:hypothetical protein